MNKSLPCNGNRTLIPECSKDSEIEARLEAVEQCCSDAHDEIDDLDGNKVDEGDFNDTVRQLEGSIGANQSDAEAKINAVNNRVSNLVLHSNQVTDTLWTGTMDDTNDSATLAHPITDYDFIDVYVSGLENGYIRRPASLAHSFLIRTTRPMTLTDSGNVSHDDSLAIRWGELKIDNDNVTAHFDTNNKDWELINSSPLAIDGNTGAISTPTIIRIDGVKSSSTTSNTEVVDARTGSDGTVYPTLKDRLDTENDDLKEDLDEILVDNFVYDGDETLTGTTYVNKLIYEGAVSDTSKKWTIEIKNVVGANAPYYALVRWLDNTDTQIAQAVSGNTLPLKWSVTPASGSAKIRMLIVASAGTALPTGTATFYDIKVYQGTERIYSIKNDIHYERLDDDELRIDALETDVAPLQDLLTPSRNIATEFIDARINNDNGAVYVPAGIFGYGATKDAAAVEPNTQYTLSLKATYGGTFLIFAYGENNSYIGRVTPDYGMSKDLGKEQSYTFTTDSNTHFIRVQVYSSTVAFDPANILVFQVEEGGITTMPVNQTIINNDLIDAETQYKKLVDNGVVVGDFNVPKYFNSNNYLNSKISRINELCESCASNGDVFIFITDEHMTAGQTRGAILNQGHSYSLIKRISDNCRIPRLFDGGDNADMGYLLHTLNLRKAFNGKIYHVTGNHDAFYQTSKNTINYYMDMYNDDQVGNYANRYYYTDNNAQKIRYIVLASSEGDATTNNENNGIFGTDTEQMAWLTNVALNVQSGWEIIVFIHMMFYVNFTVERTLNRYGTALEDALDNYSGNGKILAVIQGHTHVDRMTYTNGGIPVIMTTCDKNIPVSVGDVMDLTFDRPTGTTYEQAFDVVILDRTNKTFHFVRVGAPAQDGMNDNIGNFVEERTITYV